MRRSLCGFTAPDSIFVACLNKVIAVENQPFTPSTSVASRHDLTVGESGDKSSLVTSGTLLLFEGGSF